MIAMQHCKVPKILCCE